MVLSLFLASEWLETEDTIVAYGDIVVPPALLKSVSAAAGEICIPVDLRWQGLWEKRFGDPLIDSETMAYDPSFNLTEIGNHPRSLEQVQAQFMGMVRLTPSGWGQLRAMLGKLHLDDILRLDFTAMLSLAVKEGINVVCLPTSEIWCEVDSETDLQLANQLFA